MPGLASDEIGIGGLIDLYATVPSALYCYSTLKINISTQY
jgi:hypothetical protein